MLSADYKNETNEIMITDIKASVADFTASLA